ncbi:hypothetical protein ACF1BS_04525 [Streptomyces sp. NPDC014748]|uniref:hypothetical protein n=1 Tax=Streptomyces sp. NPDC014748 TaxID=3364905 RepID=UPI003701A98A
MTSASGHDPAAEEEQIKRHLTAQGFRVVSIDEWSRQGTLDTLREQRRRYAGDPRLEAIDELAGRLADRLTTYTDVQPRDISTVLLAAGGAVASLALVHGLAGVQLAEVLQITGDVLDRRADGGEQP